MNPTLYLSILLFTGFLSLLIAVECFNHRQILNARKLMNLMLSIGSWSFLQYLSIVISDPILKEISYNVLYIAIILTPVNFFFFVYSYTANKSSSHFNEFAQLIFVIPFINIFMLISNPVHHLFFESQNLKPFGHYTQIFSEFNIFFWIHTGFAYAITILSISLLFYEYMINRRYFKKQILMLIAGSVTPVIFNIIFLLDIRIAMYDLTPVSLLASGLLFGYAVIRYQIFTSTPISRKLTLHSIKDCVLIVDDEGMIVEYNQSLENQFKLMNDYRYSSIHLFPLSLRRIISLTSTTDNYNHQIRVADEESNIAFFKVKKIPVIEKNTQFFIYLITDANATTLLIKELDRHKEILENIKENKLHFLSSISHELRSPLNTLKGIADLLEEKSHWNPYHRQELSRMTASLHHKTNIILDYAKFESGQLKPALTDVPLSHVQLLLEPDTLVFYDLTDEPVALYTLNIFLSFLEHLVYGIKLLQSDLIWKRSFTIDINTFIAEAIFPTETAKRIKNALTTTYSQEDFTIEERLHISTLRSFLALLGGSCIESSIDLFNSRLQVKVPLKLVFQTEVYSKNTDSMKMLLIDDSVITYFICQKLSNIHHIELDYAENLLDAQAHLSKHSSYHWILIDIHLENASGYDIVHQLKTKQTAGSLFIAISSDQINTDSLPIKTHGFDHFIQKPLKSADYQNLITLWKSTHT